MSQLFLREFRLRSREDFQRVFDRKTSIADERLVIYGCENELPHCRLGRSVSRKFGNAVKRNKLRRLYREAFRQVHAELPKGLDLILIPRGKATPTLHQVLESIRRLAPRLEKRLAKRRRQNSDDDRGHDRRDAKNPKTT